MLHPILLLDSGYIPVDVPNGAWANNNAGASLRGGALTGATNNKLILAHIVARSPEAGGTRPILSGAAAIGSATQDGVGIRMEGTLFFAAWNAAGTQILNASYAAGTDDSVWYDILFSCDLSDTAKRFLYVNGVDVTGSVTWGTYTNDTIDWSGTPEWSIFAKGNGSAGNRRVQQRLFLTNEYFDISVLKNRELFTKSGIPQTIGNDGSNPTGTPPLILLERAIGESATTASQTNKGTGGNFTLDGSVVVEESVGITWDVGRVDTNGSARWTRGAGLTGASDAKTGSCVFWIRPRTSQSNRLISAVTTVAGSTERFSVRLNANRIQVVGWNSGGTTILDLTSTTSLSTSFQSIVMFSWDLTNSSNRPIYINNTADSWGTVTTYTDDTIDYTIADWGLGAIPNGSSILDADYIGYVWFSTEYIDFTSSTVRAKFVDSDGLPVYPGATGALPTGTQPLILAHIGVDDGYNGLTTIENLGSGGTFTGTGTPGVFVSTPTEPSFEGYQTSIT